MMITTKINPFPPCPTKYSKTFQRKTNCIRDEYSLACNSFIFIPSYNIGAKIKETCRQHQEKLLWNGKLTLLFKQKYARLPNTIVLLSHLREMVACACNLLTLWMVINLCPLYIYIYRCINNTRVLVDLSLFVNAHI